MFLILKLMLIILINTTDAYAQNSEIKLLPAWNTTRAKEISLTFKVFGKLMRLNLHRNNQVVSSKCHEGLLFVQNDLLEIRPLQNVFASPSFIKDYCVKEQSNQSFGKPHFIKKSLQSFTGSDLYHLYKRSKRHYTSSKLYVDEISRTIELAIFVDAKAYNSMMKLLHFNIEKVLDVMLAYVNRIQALFHHPSLGAQIDILLVRLDFMEKQPSNLPIYSDNSFEMLESFCKYARNLNPWSDDDPRHWDIGLYITGLNIVEIRKSFGISNEKIFYGLARSNISCNLRFSCALATLPSEKFENEDGQLEKFEEVAEQSSIAAAHEIGHLLGLEHDSKEECESNLAYIMCTGGFPSHREVWSSHSRNMIKSKLEKYLCLLDHTELQNISYDGQYWPIHVFDISSCYDYLGREQSAKAQCELFLKDKDANVVTLHDICENLQCETPRQNKSYFTGRPLNGTYCELEKECCNGKCVPVIEPPFISKYCAKDNWSEWQEYSCNSSCLVKSRGILVKRRVCEHLGQKTANCAGPYYDVVLCDDSLLCIEKRKTIAEFTTKKCFEFSKFVKNANMTLELLIASGSQIFHDVQKPWQACTVFCRLKDTADWFTARENMFDHSVDPYFPDGTWCHNKDGQDYFCRQHYCLPENYSFVKSEECKNNC